MQEVFIHIFESINNFRENYGLSTWIYKISVSVSLDFLRKKKAKKRFALFQKIFYNEKNEVEKIPDTGKTAEEDYDNTIREKILDSEIGKLSRKQQIAVRLYYINGLNNSEISKIMGETISAVDSIIHRAKQKLKKNLYNYYIKRKNESF